MQPREPAHGFRVIAELRQAHIRPGQIENLPSHALNRGLRSNGIHRRGIKRRRTNLGEFEQAQV